MPPRRSSQPDEPEEAAIRRGDDGVTFDDPPTTEVGFQLAEKTVGGRFKLGERLSWGGMGTVYRALDLVTQREVAVKIPHLGDPVNDVRFHAESAAVRSVVCTSVIGYVAHGDDAAEPFLAMELVAGEPLWKHLQRGPLDPASTFAVGRRVASALAAIHLGGWIHRDIKPGNLVVAPDGSVKLLDFGLSRALDRDENITQTGQLVGTLGYMAPEQFGGVRPVDPRTDVYALGVVLFECMTGRRAFTRTLPEVIAAPPSGRLDLRALRAAGTGGAPLAEVISRAVSPDPADRPADGLELLLQLLSADQPRFNGVAYGAARDAIEALFRGGAAHLHGDATAASLIAEIFAEAVAPSIVLRVACDPLVAEQPLGHVGVIGALFEAWNQLSLAQHLQNGDPSNSPAPTRNVILVLEDAAWCDGPTLTRLARLVRQRALYVIFASSFEGEIPEFDAPPIPTERMATGTRVAHADELSQLDPLDRWFVRAAAMFGRRFPVRGVEELVGGVEASAVAGRLARLADRGIFKPIEGQPKWFGFASAKRLNQALGFASPQVRRLGTRLASAFLMRVDQRDRGASVDHVASVDVDCAKLAHDGSR